MSGSGQIIYELRKLASHSEKKNSWGKYLLDEEIYT